MISAAILAATVSTSDGSALACYGLGAGANAVAKVVSSSHRATTPRLPSFRMLDAATKISLKVNSECFAIPRGYQYHVIDCAVKWGFPFARIAMVLKGKVYEYPQDGGMWLIDKGTKLSFCEDIHNTRSSKLGIINSPSQTKGLK